MLVVRSVALNETIAPSSRLRRHACRWVLEKAVAPASACRSCACIVHCCKVRTGRSVGGHDVIMCVGGRNYDS